MRDSIPPEPVVRSPTAGRALRDLRLEAHDARQRGAHRLDPRTPALREQRPREHGLDALAVREGDVRRARVLRGEREARGELHLVR